MANGGATTPFPAKKSFAMYAKTLVSAILAGGLAGGGFTVPSLAQGERVTITKLRTAGNCSAGDVGVIHTNDQDVLRAKFDSLSASATGASHDKEACVLRYDLGLPKGQRLGALAFAVDSRYQLSEGGEVRITVKHRVGNSKSFGRTEFRATEDGDDSPGRIDGLAGVLEGKNLSIGHQRQGATIPVTTTIIVAAVNETKDETAIRALEGVSTITVKP